LNYELFIARRFRSAKKDKSSISAPIIKIAITAIALGMVMMLVTLATGLGLQNKIREKIAVFKGHVQIVSFDNNVLETTQNPISKTQDFYPDFSALPGAKHVQVFASKAGVIRTETDFEGVVFKGVDTGYDWSGIEEYLVSGTLPLLEGATSNEVLISSVLSKRLDLKLGTAFDTYFVKNQAGKLPNRRIFKVAGIYNSGFKDFDETYVLGDIRHLQKINKWQENQVGGFEVFLEDFDAIEILGDQIYSSIDPVLNSHTLTDLYPDIFDWLRLFDTNIAIIIGLMIWVAGINMITALLVLILERTQTIGILKTLGSTNWSIRKLFLYNASYLILRGLVIGNAIGISLLLFQKYFGIIRLNPDTYYVDTAPVYLNLWHAFFLNLGTLLLCLLMLLLPSFLITRVRPAKAVKFE